MARVLPYTATDDERWLSPTRAAKGSGVSISSLAKWADDGLLEHRKTPGGHRRFRLSDIAALLDRTEQEAS